MPILLTRDDLRPLLEDPRCFEAAFAAIERAFQEHRQRGGPATPQLALPLRGGSAAVRLVVATSPAAGVTLRATSGGPGVPSVDTAAIFLFDPETGQLLALMAGDDLGVFRTAVPAGVGCRYLAPPQSRRVGMLGSGRQARGQLVVIRHALPSLERVRVYSPTPAHRAEFARAMSQRLGLPVEAVDDPFLAIQDADVIGITSSAREPVLHRAWIRPGAHVISIAGGQLPADLVLNARIVVSSRADIAGPAARREPYTSLIASGAWDPTRAVEMVDVITGAAPARTRPDEIVIYEMPGMGVWDTAIFAWAYQWARQNGIGTPFHLS